MAGSAWSPLTRRESVLLAMVERRLTNIEIADELHISVRTVESHIASLRRKLGVDSRAKLITAARTQRGAHVQVPRNAFLGRGDDIAAVRRLLDTHCWVTVVGAAGCGKTRMALELAAAEEKRTPLVVELEKASAQGVVGTVAKAIGLESGTTPDLMAACGVALGAHRYLLVLDNCDRVTDAVGDVARKLIGMAASLRVLATSRAPVGASDETVYPLAPLPVVDTPMEGAVRLFLDRAWPAVTLPEVSKTDRSIVTGICRRLDGLPLAIELAAARVRHLPLAELAARLEDGFDALDRAGGPDRHRTLEAAFDWTWDLLDDEERSVLSRLAALPRTFDVELAEAVTSPGSGRVVFRLLDRSLVSRTARVSDPIRFRLLGSLRAFVLDRTSRDVVDEVRHAHALHYMAVAGELSRRARTDDSRAAAEQANQLCPEVNAAVEWASSRHLPELVLPLARALAIGGEQYGPDVDSRRTIARAARDPEVRRISSGQDLFAFGLALSYRDLDQVTDLATYALETAHDDASRLAAHHLVGLGEAYRHRGRSAMPHLDEAERLADELLDMWQLAAVRQTRGIALWQGELHDPEAAMAAFESAMHAYALAGDAMHVNNARYMMASVAAEAGLDTDRARVWVEECAAYARASGNRHELAHALLTRAALSSTPDSTADLQDALQTFHSVGDLRCLTRGYLILAEHAPASARVSLLERALHFAQQAHDVSNQAVSLERLILALWTAGDRRSAAVTFGGLVSLIGYDAAAARCPAPLRQRLDEWTGAVVEGQARRARPFSPAGRA